MYENFRKIATSQGDDSTTACLQDYPYFKENYKMILWFQRMYIKKKDHAGNATMFLIPEKVKDTFFYLSQRTVRVLSYVMRLM